MPLASYDELHTVVENKTGGERVFGFLGPRGMRLGAGEVVAIPGDLVASLGAQYQRGGNRRRFDAMQRSLKNGSLQINSRPMPIVYDAVAEQPVGLAVVSGALGTVAPTYTTDASDSFDAV
jgi:hypothetical protein